MGDEASEAGTPRAALPSLLVEVCTVRVAPEECHAWSRVRHAGVTVRLQLDGQPEVVERTQPAERIGHRTTGFHVSVNETLSIALPADVSTAAPAGTLLLGLRRGVAAGGFAAVALAEPMPLAAVWAAAQAAQRADTFLTVPLLGKRGEGPAGQVLLRVALDNMPVPRPPTPPETPREEEEAPEEEAAETPKKVLDAAATRIQAVFRGNRARKLQPSRPPPSVASSEAAEEDEEVDEAAIDEAVESILPPEPEPEPEREPSPEPAPATPEPETEPAAPVEDDDTYSWWSEYERNEWRKRAAILAAKVLGAAAAALFVKRRLLGGAGRTKRDAAAPTKQKRCPLRKPLGL